MSTVIYNIVIIILFDYFTIVIDFVGDFYFFS